MNKNDDEQVNSLEFSTRRKCSQVFGSLGYFAAYIIISSIQNYLPIRCAIIRILARIMFHVAMYVILAKLVKYSLTMLAS